MRNALPALLVVFFVLAGPLQAADQKAERKASQAKRLNKTLTEFQKMKVRERTLKVLIRRSKGNRYAAYKKEFDELRPRIYEAAQTMEKQVQDFERVYGRKTLCKIVEKEVQSVVGVCTTK